MSNPIIIRRKGVTEIVPRDSIGRTVTVAYRKPYEKPYESAKPAQSEVSFGFGEGFLNEARKNRTGIRIKLADGKELSGLISAYDNETIYFLLSPDHMEAMLLYKHAIAALETVAE
ncbi:MAG: RNA chaperone Hfq [Geobacteraceae bacterium]|nr:RNA chaperone Hfq [Geobacteraceae bacterium]